MDKIKQIFVIVFTVCVLTVYSIVNGNFKISFVFESNMMLTSNCREGDNNALRKDVSSASDTTARKIYPHKELKVMPQCSLNSECIKDSGVPKCKSQIFVKLSEPFLFYDSLDYHKLLNISKSTIDNKMAPKMTSQADDILRLPCDYRSGHYVTYVGQGRAGNQLFQLATAYAVAKRYGLHVKIPPRPRDELVDGLKMYFPVDDRSGNQTFTNLLESVEFYDTRVEYLNPLVNIQLGGFFQSYRYFDHIRDEIVSLFTFKEEYTQKAREFIKSSVQKFGLTNKKHTIIGLHIRIAANEGEHRYRHPYYFKSNFKNYIKRAMDYFESRFSNCLFIIVSPMTRKAKLVVDSTDKRVVYSENDHWTDMVILTLTDHNIMTVGSFGWWGSYLNKNYFNMTVMYINPLSIKDIKQAKCFQNWERIVEDMFPSHWIGRGV